MSGNPVLDSSLYELDKSIVLEPSNPSSLTVRIFNACNKKLKHITSEELRLLVSQVLGLEYTVPLALSLLEDNPLVFTGLYNGDLLEAILTLPTEFWKERPILNNRLAEIRITVEDMSKTLNEDIIPKIEKIKFIKVNP